MFHNFRTHRKLLHDFKLMEFLDLGSVKLLLLESEVMRDPGSIPTWGNILFLHSKKPDANIGIIANVMCF